MIINDKETENLDSKPVMCPFKHLNRIKIISSIAAQMLGQAIGGVFPALVDICIVSLNVKEEDVGSVCFAIATVVLFLCMASLIWALVVIPSLQGSNSLLRQLTGGAKKPIIFGQKAI